MPNNLFNFVISLLFSSPCLLHLFFLCAFPVVVVCFLCFCLSFKLNDKSINITEKCRTKCCYGLSMDLLEKVASELGFEFHLYIVRDELFGGTRDKYGESMKFGSSYWKDFRFYDTRK